MDVVYSIGESLTQTNRYFMIRKPVTVQVQLKSDHRTFSAHFISIVIKLHFIISGLCLVLCTVSVLQQFVVFTFSKQVSKQ